MAKRRPSASTEVARDGPAVYGTGTGTTTVSSAAAVGLNRRTKRPLRSPFAPENRVEGAVEREIAHRVREGSSSGEPVGPGAAQPAVVGDDPAVVVLGEEDVTPGLVEGVRHRRAAGIDECHRGDLLG